jgi:hypothetical protein
VTSKWLSLCVLCVSAILSPLPSQAQLQEIQPAEPQWMTEMYGQGWQKVAEGVLQRSEGPGNPVETFIYNEDGLRWRIQWLQGRVSQFESLYGNSPSEDLARFIEGLENEIEQTQDRIDSGQVEPYTGEQTSACTPLYSATADAAPLTGAQAPGVTARATAQFSSGCGDLGMAYSTVYVHAVAGTVETTRTQTDIKPEATSVSTLAQDSASGSTDCVSTATARVESSALNILYTVSDDNFFCQPPLTVTVSGTPSYYTYASGPQCATATWTASASGGTPGYTIDWYIGTAYQSSGTTLSKTYCNVSTSVTVTAKLRDSAGQTAQDSYTTRITYQGSTCWDPCGMCDPIIKPKSSADNETPTCSPVRPDPTLEPVW